MSNFFFKDLASKSIELELNDNGFFFRNIINRVSLHFFIIITESWLEMFVCY